MADYGFKVVPTFWGDRVDLVKASGETIKLKQTFGKVQGEVQSQDKDGDGELDYYCSVEYTQHGRSGIRYFTKEVSLDSRIESILAVAAK